MELELPEIREFFDAPPITDGGPRRARSVDLPAGDWRVGQAEDRRDERGAA